MAKKKIADPALVGAALESVIDKAGKLHQEIKEREEKLKDLKKQILELGDDRENVHIYRGKQFSVVLVPATTTTIHPDLLWDACEGDPAKYLNVSKPDVTKCRKTFDEDTIEEISSTKAGTTRIHFNVAEKNDEELKKEVASKLRGIDLD